MSGKVAKPKEDKDASKGKRLSLIALHRLLFTPFNHRFHVTATMRPFIPYMVLQSPSEVRLKTSGC